MGLLQNDAIAPSVLHFYQYVIFRFKKLLRDETAIQLTAVDRDGFYTVLAASGVAYFYV